MKLRVVGIQDVVESQLCSGCGACAYISPQRIEMIDALEGRRPRLINGHADDDEVRQAMLVCPGVSLEGATLTGAELASMTAAWGPVIEVWEGSAADEALRFSGSSGGAASALAAYAMEQEGFAATLHIAAREDVPYLNETVLSRSRQELLARTGSRYAPASPCDGLNLIEESQAPCVFIGKPCDVAATAKARAIRSRLDEKLGLSIAMFCAGTPSTSGTIELLHQMGIDPAKLTRLRYRGNGWPGDAVADSIDGDRVAMSYEESWGKVLSGHVQWRCRLCPDHTGEFADVAVGDPWHTPPKAGEMGRSLVIARTARGRDLVRRAVDAGYLRLTLVSPHRLAHSQPNLLRARAAVWGRLAALRAARISTPQYTGLPLFRHWLWKLSLGEKLRSFVGTIARIDRRKLRQRHEVVPMSTGSTPIVKEC